MKNHLIFNPTRAMQLFRNDLRMNYKQLLIGTGAVLAILTFFGWAGINDGADSNFHNALFPIAQIIIGCILTGYAFKEMRNPHERQFYLSLPASHLEKFSVRWFITVVCFPICFTILYFIFSKLFDSYANYQGHEIMAFNPFTRGGLIFLLVYLAVQSLFLLGSIWFRRLNLVKTPAALLAVTLVSAAIFLLLFRIIFMDAFPNGTLFAEPSGTLQPNKWLSGFFEDVVIDGIQVLFFFVLPLFLWLVSYLKLTEKQA